MKMIPLNEEEAKIYFTSSWYKEIMKNKRKQLIKLNIIKQRK